MKNNLLKMFLLTFSLLNFFSCKDKDPEVINEEEVITTLKMSFIPRSGGNDVEVLWKDVDGESGNDPEIINPVLEDNTVYDVNIELMNETISPAEDVTEEIEEEGEEHQFFFDTSSDLNLTFSYNDTDENGKPIGLSSMFLTGNASTGTLKVILRHQPDKEADGVEDGVITSAGGETDIEVTFNVTIK